MSAATVDVAATVRALPGADPLDAQVATMLVRRTGETGEAGLALALAAMLTSRALREGHSALTLTQLVQQAAAWDAASLLRDAAVHDEAWWSAQLSASRAVGTGALLTPMVLCDGLLQFHRWFAAEQRIASRVAALLALPVTDGVPGFSIVTGGPGTGKTTRVAALLVQMVREAPGLRVALAAPTGKAAARLTESIRQRIATVAGDATEPSGVTRALLELEARTLHRLLSYHGESDTFGRTAAHPLDADLVIIDEASMVDVLLLDAVLQALRPGARLMLVGDHHQLSSVDAGDVLGVLVRAAAQAPAASPMRTAVTQLTTSWRFDAASGIGAMAQAILDGSAAQLLQVGRPGTDSARVLVPEDDVPRLSPVLPHLERCVAATSPDALLAALEAFRILSPEREGPAGVRGLNAAVERWLARRGRDVREAWYHGRPVLVTANDYATRVFNGDIGVTWHEGGRVAVYFRGADGRVRAVAPGRLPAVETAWAMTVHKSQGSEFDDVLVVLPEESRVMSRELLYTAVTRARQRVTLAGPAAAVGAAVMQVTRRTSGLPAALGRQPVTGGGPG